MVFPEYLPLVDAYRSCNIDCRYFGLAFLFNSRGLVKSYGRANGAKFYLRSLFKPIQASVISDFCSDFTEAELAIMQGSHSGSKMHVELVQNILKKISLTQENLLCPAIEPLDKSEYAIGEAFSKLHNNCSGKHAMMLAYCVYHGLDISNYTDFSHPVQIKIKEKLLKYASIDFLDNKNFITTKDGCGAPVYGLEIQNIAKAFLNYYKDEKNKKLIQAYKNNPRAAGGCDASGVRTDTRITELSPDLISKVGAGGFIYVYNFKTEQILIIKMAQNNNKERELAALEALFRLNWLRGREFDNKIYLEDGRKIGEYKFNF